MFESVTVREQTGLILTRIDEIFKGYPTFPTPVISLTPILLSNAGGTGGGDLCKTPQNPVWFSSSELWRFLRWGDDDKFNFCAALKAEKRDMLEKYTSQNIVNFKRNAFLS